MARRLAPVALAVLGLALAGAGPAAAAPLDALVAHDLKFAGAQLNRTLAEVPSGSFPHETNTNGTWGTHPAGWWTSGFFPGSLWLMYKATGNAAWRSAAAARQAAIESQKTRTDTHDLGFMLFDSFGNGWKLTNDDSYRQILLTAAGSLDTRYSSVVHATRSWNNASSDSPTDFKVIVDNMMNLELLDWASKHGGSSAYASHALEHALTTAREHVRPDGSTYHLVVFDSSTGAVKRKGTVQGYSDSSTWSRGQAWAVYGFTLAYRETGDSRMLDTARRVADYYVSHLPADYVPYWDFQAPGIPNEPRDSSAAAIAASGLIELAQLDPDATRSRRYLGVAESTLASLSSPAYLAEGTSSRSILLHGTANKPGGEYDRGLIYGDYFFLEALLRYRAMATASGPAADFNGDGYGDTAIGSPGEDSGAGVFGAMYGGGAGLGSLASHQFSQGAVGGATEPGDRFGDAVASADFNGDGYADAAVGAPGEDGGAGAVSVVYGGASGLSAAGAKQFTQGLAGGSTRSGDQFGAALAGGDFNGDGFADLAVGAPGEDTNGAGAGAVNVLYGSASGLGSSGARQLTQGDAAGGSEAGDHFGAALAAGAFNDDQRADLAVGAPGEDDSNGNDVGFVNVVYGSPTGLTGAGARQLSQSSARGVEEGGDHFGAALAAGDFNGDPIGDLAVGTPDEDTAAGADVGYVNVLYGSSGGLTSTGARQLSQYSANGAEEPGDHFGAAVASGDFDGDARSDLAVGAPGEDSSAGADVGFVNVLFGSATGIPVSGGKQLSQSSARGAEEPGDEFGAALGSSNYDGNGVADLLVGAPGEDSAVGADIGYANVLYGAMGGSTARQLDQSSAGGGGEPGDLFGSAVR